MENVEYALMGVAFVGFFAGGFGLYYLTAWIVRQLAERNLFFTIADEGTAKAVIVNGKFDRFIMSFMGREFTDVVVENDIATRWDIGEADDVEEHRAALPFMRGIQWIGFPPFNDIHQYKFTWSSLEEVPNEKGELVKRPVQNSKRIDYVLVQSDIYVTRLEEAECKDKIPLNGNIIFAAKVVNPYKALYRIERWLESVENLLTARMREYFGAHHYEELIELASNIAGDDSSELMEQFQSLIDFIKDKYGVLISSIRISTIDPGSALAEEFIRATTKVYVAEQQAAADKVAGEGLAARDTAHYKAISDIPGASDFYKWDRIANSHLSTYVEGGGSSRTGINLGGGKDSPAPSGEDDRPASP